MRTTQDLVKHNDAASMLGITPSWLTNLVRQGMLLPARKGGKIRDNLYHAAEVNALLRLRGQSVDLPSVANLAVQARALSQTTAAKMDMLCRFLGIEPNRLSLEEEDMFQLHERAVNALQCDFHTLRAGAILDWAAVFNAIDEAYLAVLEHVTENASPWALYLQLANELAQKRSVEADSNLTFAYACLDSSRRSLRHTAYFYVLSKAGRRRADQLFVEGAGVEEVIAQLFPNVVELHGADPLGDTLKTLKKKAELNHLV